MKIIRLFLLAMFILPLAKAQDTGLDKYYFKTQENLFPKKNLAPEKRTYKYTGLTSDTLNFNENNAIVVNGFKKDDKGTVEVLSGYGSGLKWAEQETRSRVDPGTKATFYSVVVVAICDGRVKLDCKEIDYKWYSSEQFRKTYSTKEFSTAKQATDEFYVLLKSWRDDAKINLQKFVVLNTNYYANKVFGYTTQNLNIKLWLLGSKEHPEYANFQKNYLVIKTAFAEVKADAIPKDIVSKLAPAIEYFESVPKLFSEDNKKHKKMRYAAYYNLMKIYFNIEDFTKAETYANLVVSNDYDGKDGKKLLEAIKEKKAVWEANKQSSSHFFVAGETGFDLTGED